MRGVLLRLLGEIEYARTCGLPWGRMAVSDDDWDALLRESAVAMDTSGNACVFGVRVRHDPALPWGAIVNEAP